jgi:hypothetical protein
MSTASRGPQVEAKRLNQSSKAEIEKLHFKIYQLIHKTFVPFERSKKYISIALHRGLS